MANTPSPQNYTLGKGVLYFDKYDSSAGTYEGARDLGNSPEVSINIAPEKLEHFSSRGGLKVKDKSVVSEMNMKISFSLDEPNIENLAMMFMAEQEEVTQAAVTAGTKGIASVKQGRYYDLGARGITAESVSVETDPAGTPVVKTEGTDFVIDYVRGRIFIPYTSTIVDADEIEVSFDAAEQTYTKLKAMQETEIEGRLIFISDNPVGVNYDLTAHRASLTPSGDLSLIGEDWMNLSYEAEIMKDETGHPDSPYMDIIKI
jgi:hypothetical protein